MKTAFLLFAACAGAQAQLELYLLGTPAVETPAGARLDCGTVANGDFGDLRLRIRNSSTKPEVLRSAFVSGTGFSVENIVALPYSVPAGLNVDFRIRFRPTGAGSYSGMFTVNEKSWFVSGRSPEAATLLVDGATVTGAIPVDFGRIERGSKSSRKFVLRNSTGVRLVVKSVSVEQGAFSIAPLALPLELANGAEGAFEVLYAPLRSGVHRSNLEVDGRAIALEGMATEPPFPEAQLKLLSSSMVSGEQARIGISFASASRATGSGLLTVTGLSGDAAVQFVANSSRSLRVTVREGDTDLMVNGLKEIYLQTGTTAGRLTVEFELDGRKTSLSRDIAPSGVNVESLSALRTSSGVQLRMLGFDNTRSAGPLAFYFYDAAGALIGGQPVTADASNLFRQYFRKLRPWRRVFFECPIPGAGQHGAHYRSRSRVRQRGRQVKDTSRQLLE